ncbi:MAG: neutral zinc metallopeptidase [Acidimicrobiales bacterium]
MASSPEGPGWWQASDGQWYPPESHPGYQPPAAAPPAYQQPQAPQQPQPQAPQQPPAYGQAPAYGQPPAYGQQPGFGAPPVPPTPAKSGNGKALLVVAIIVVLVLIAGVVAAVALGDDTSKSTKSSATTTTVVVGRKADPKSTGGKTGTEPDKSIKENAPDTTGDLAIVGAADTDETKVVSAAITDIQSFWTKEMPKTFGTDYQPVEGGFYSWSPDEALPPCADTPDGISGNAFYCGNADDVAWDDTDLIPHLYETYGDLSVAIVFAHEWGHAIQARTDVSGLTATVSFEEQADCYAGAWVQHVRDGGSKFFTADGPALDQALAGFLEIADTPGSSAMDENAHGSAFDRITSFKDGLDDGAATCKDYTDESIGARLTEIEFSEADAANGGNMNYEDIDADHPGIITLATADLEDYWSTIAKQKFQKTWTPLEPAKPFDGTGSKTPDCGGADTSGYTLFYCAPDRFIAYDNVGLFPDVYDSLGDFAVAALYGSQYSLAAQDQLGIAPEKARDQNLMADCMTGSWAASVFLGDRPETGSLSLSAGDFDEAIKVLLALGSKEDDGGNQGTGFERVSAFRNGVINGVDSCEQG